MSTEQMTNEVDGESIRATKQDDGTIVVEAAPCDDDGMPHEWATWKELAVRHHDGSIDADPDPDTWTDARTTTVNNLLRMV